MARSAKVGTPVPTTLDELVREWDYYIGSTIYKISRGRIREEDAYDYKQQVYSRLASTGALDRYDPAKGKFSTYLFAIVRSVVCNEFGKNERAATNNARPIAYGPTTIAGAERLDRRPDPSNFEEGLQVRDVLVRLDKHVRTLKDGARLVKTLRRLLAGRQPGEIAKELGYSPSLVTDHRRQLRDVLARRFGIGPA